MPDAKPESVPAASPPSSTESWPLTEVGASDDGKLASSARSPTPTLTESAMTKSPAIDPPVATEDSATGKEATPASEVRGDVSGPLADSETTDKPTEDTSSSEDWSRTRLPIPDEDGAASGIDEPAVALASSQKPNPEEVLAALGAGDAQTQTRSLETPRPEASAAAPVGMSGTGETSAAPVSSAATPEKIATDGTRIEVAVDSPRLEGAGDCARPGRPAFLVTRPTENGVNEEAIPSQPSTPIIGTAIDTKTRLPASRGDTPGKQDAAPPILKIKTLLSDTEQFSASPVAATATSPRTRAFFNTDFSVGLRSPPRVGGAIITEIASDTEFTLIEKINRTTVQQVLDGHEPEAQAARQPGSARRPLPPQAFVASSHAAPESGRFDPIPSSPLRHAAASAPRRLPFVNGRTIVSTAVPRLLRAESLRQHRQRQEPFEAAASRLPHGRYEPDEPARRQDPCRQDPRRQDPRRQDPRRQDPPPYSGSGPSRARPAAPDTRADHPRRSPTPSLGETPLQALILELQAGLEADPAVYYAVRGVLSAYEEQTGRAPARASSVDEPPSRLARLRERVRAANKAEGTRARSPGTLRRTRVSFDDETSGDGMPFTAPPQSRKPQQHASEHVPKGSPRRARLGEPTKATSERSAGPPTQGTGASPSSQLSPWSRARVVKADPPAEAKRSFGGKARLDDKHDPTIKRRHSFDSTVDYKPGRKAAAAATGGKNAHARPPIPPVHRTNLDLYHGPRAFVSNNAEIIFSLADIQPYAPSRGLPETGPRHDHREPAVKPVDSKNAGRRHATIPRPFPYGRTAREQHRDNSITFDFDDFF